MKVKNEMNSAKAVQILFNRLAKAENPHAKFTSDGTMLLSKDEAALNAVADFLEDVGLDVVTGYYDPTEDSRNGEEDSYSGYYYLDLA